MKVTGIATVVIAAPAAVMNLGDVLNVSVSLTGLTTRDATLHAVLYQAIDNGSFSPIDQSTFSVPPIQIPAGGQSAGFQMSYQKLTPPGTHVVNVVLEIGNFLATDPTNFPVTHFASFAITSAGPDMWDS